MMVTPEARNSRTTCHISLRSSTSTPAVGSSRNRMRRLVRERLGDQYAPLHAARQRHDLVVFLVPQRQLAQNLFDIGRGSLLAEQPPAVVDRRPHRLEHVGRQFLRHQPDLGPGLPVARDDVVAVDRDAAARRPHDAAHDVDEGGLARAIGAEQREDLAAVDGEIDGLQRLEAGTRVRACPRARGWGVDSFAGRRMVMIGCGRWSMVTVSCPRAMSEHRSEVPGEICVQTVAHERLEYGRDGSYKRIVCT